MKTFCICGCICDSGSSMKNTESSKPKTYLKLDNLAIFKGDKFINWTTTNESYGINIINNHVSEMYIKIKRSGFSHSFNLFIHQDGHKFPSCGAEAVQVLG